MIERDEEVELRMPWDLICTVACQALVWGTTFEAAVQRMLHEQMERLKTV